jgi:hypothetical protein
MDSILNKEQRLYGVWYGFDIYFFGINKTKTRLHTAWYGFDVDWLTLEMEKEAKLIRMDSIMIYIGTSRGAMMKVHSLSTKPICNEQVRSCKTYINAAIYT